MIGGAAIAAWSRDEARQAHARARQLAVARDWAEAAQVRAFRAALDAAGGDEARTIAAARALFAENGWAEALVARLVAEAAADPFFEPPFRAIAEEAQSGLILLDDPRCRVSLSRIALDALAARKAARGGMGTIGFSGAAALYHFLDGGGATLAFWSAVAPGADFRLANAPPCTFAGRRRIADGETLLLDGRAQAFVIEHAARDLLLLQALPAPPPGALRIDHDARTGRALRAEAADDAGSRIAMIAGLLRLFDRADAFEPIAAAMAEAPFHLRWDLMRELTALDAARAGPLLRVMAAEDPHPELRHAAARTLELLACPA